MGKGHLFVVFERHDDEKLIIAVCNKEYLGRIYSGLQNHIGDISQKELLQLYPHEKVYSDNFTYNHESGTVNYNGIAYQRNPENIIVDSGNTRIDIK